MHVTSITKSNAQGYGMVLWDRTFDAVKEEYPDITTDSLLIDAACMDFIRRPQNFDVVVASNLIRRYFDGHRSDHHRVDGFGVEC